MSKSKFTVEKIADKVVEAIVEMPGNHAWAIADVIGIPASFFKRERGTANRGDDTIRAALRSGESKGLIESRKVDGKRLWFPTEDALKAAGDK